MMLPAGAEKSKNPGRSGIETGFTTKAPSHKEEGAKAESLIQGSWRSSIRTLPRRFQPVRCLIGVLVVYYGI